MAILISSKADFRTKKISRKKECYFIVIKEQINQEDIQIPNICAPDNRSSKYMKQNPVEWQGETDKSTVML